MSNASITYLVAACCGVLVLAAFTAFILVPAWSSYTRVWERIAASFMSLYVLAALLALGAGLGSVIVYFWDRISP